MTAFEIFLPERDDVGNVISHTLRRDTVHKPEEALIEIYRKLRPGDPPTLDTATALFEGMFFDPRKYDFSRVGRLKFNIKLYDKQDATSLDHRTLTPEDFYATIRYLLKLRKNIGEVDDIDHLGNRRVRAVGELMENQFRIGLVRMERAIKEKMSVYPGNVDGDAARPDQRQAGDGGHPRVLRLVSSSRSSWIRRIRCRRSRTSAGCRRLGRAVCRRERAGFEVRDVHPTHYGRICPIETPEGPNIGLISLAVLLCAHQRVRLHRVALSQGRGRPRDRLRAGSSMPATASLQVGDHLREARRRSSATSSSTTRSKRPIEYRAVLLLSSAWEEDKLHHRPGQRRTRQERQHRRTSWSTRGRQGEFVLVNRDEVDYIDVSPKQLVSVAASLIPFLENDDANRALMGSNMQRQSVPLLRAEAPFVGTGMEDVTARDSGAVVTGAPRWRGRFGRLRAHHRSRRRRASSDGSSRAKLARTFIS